jgi:uncharacterized BrkB/YihY/UPF0761 family membrane protein
MINKIVIIRIVAVILFFIAFIISSKVHSKTEKRTDIWLLISTLLLIACAESAANALQWLEIFPKMVDIFGEYLNIMFSLVWIYISYNIISEVRKGVSKKVGNL